MAKLKIKTVIQILFFVAVAVAVLAQLQSVYDRWRIGREIRAEIWKSARVAVIKLDPRFPPGMIVEYENGSRYTVETTHFRLVFETGTRPVARADRDFRALRPGEKKHVLLESVTVSPSARPPGRGTKLTYHLLVFPNNRKPLPEITGELEVR